MGFSKENFPSYGESANYIAFFEKELLPYIEKNTKLILTAPLSAKV